MITVGHFLLKKPDFMFKLVTNITLAFSNLRTTFYNYVFEMMLSGIPPM